MDTSDDLRFDRGDGTPGRLRRQLSRLLGMTSAQASRVASEALAPLGAHKAHFVVLAVLAEGGPASQSEIADRARIYRSDLVAVLNELAEGGWIVRAPDPADKRRNTITITDRGRGRLAEIEAVLDDVNDRVMAPLSEAERAQLFSLLGRVNAHLASGGGASPAP
ncbi:MAG: MarR family transcriptional regulator [Glycomyces artemisiae]|uniref:MarR family transcriptional regulator n=1 Tax=Glycomyces artemisiae TaxID=1076443 RepID=A0A2T0UMS1_9ACTN|nr:MarR family transcriptional regulator [Glycomyces artemisiae]NUQ90491.1 MarR family transcriptional regulator [Glycomyces artemisiae]PRY59168.1 DNA-binding MarR family transcriptional regulator [Glycomyces artemisiae]